MTFQDRTMLVLTVSVALGLLASGCADDDDGGAALDTTSVTTTAPSDPTTIPTTTTTAATTTTTVAAAITLHPDGFGAATFEGPSDPVPLVTAALGAPSSDDVNTECGAGPLRIVTWGSRGTQLLFRPATNAFVGYHVRSTSLMAATEVGVRLGSTVNDVRAAYPAVDIRTGTLGPEWVVQFGGPERYLAGFLTATDGSGTVTGIYAGVTCFFR